MSTLLPSRSNPVLTQTSCWASVTAVVIDALYDDLDDLEDELELAAEEAYLTEAALEEADAADAAGGTQTMADLEKK